MDVLGSKRDFVLFLNEYVKRFDALLTQGELADGTDFFHSYNNRIAMAAVELLDGEEGIELVGCCVGVISLSFDEGSFKPMLFEKAIGHYRNDLKDTLDRSVCERVECRIFREFVRYNFRYATPEEICEWFLRPLLKELSCMAQENFIEDKVFSLCDLRRKKMETSQATMETE